MATAPIVRQVGKSIGSGIAVDRAPRVAIDVPSTTEIVFAFVKNEIVDSGAAQSNRYGKPAKTRADNSDEMSFHWCAGHVCFLANKSFASAA